MCYAYITKLKKQKTCMNTVVNYIIVTHCFFGAPLGMTWQTKVSNVRKELSEKGLDAFVITALDETACKH